MSITASFEITGWDETTYDAPEEGPPRVRARLTLIYALAARS
jgi:hypothetical protein